MLSIVMLLRGVVIISYFVYMQNNHCHRVTTQLQFIIIMIIIIIIIIKEVKIQEFVYRDATNVEPEMYGCTGNNWSHWNINEKLKEKF